MIAYRSVICSQQPTLEQTRHPMSQRQQVLTHIRRLPDHLVPVSQTGQSNVAGPSVSTHRTARFDRLLNSMAQAVPRSIRPKGMSVTHTAHNGTKSGLSANLCHFCTADSETLPANAASEGIQDKPLRSQTDPRTPAKSWDSLPLLEILHLVVTGVKCIPL